jgi:3-dehydroquinate synthase
MVQRAWYKEVVPLYEVNTGHQRYAAVVERGVLSRASEYVPETAGKVFVATNQEVWRLHGDALAAGLQGRPFEVLCFNPGEDHKKLSSVEVLAEKMMQAGGDRTSLVIAFGGGIVGDMGGFLAAVFMRGIPVIQVPTTLLAQVDAAVGGKTGVNLVAGKNLVGSFHQPLAVLIDPETLKTLPEREYRAGLYEVVKHGIIADVPLFEVLEKQSDDVLQQKPDVLERIIADSVRIKAQVVSADEREGGLRRILNFGHTFGHALEAETRYSRFLHGEAVAFGMNAATHLSHRLGMISVEERDRMLAAIALYGPIPSLDSVRAQSLAKRLLSDKKTLKGKVHFVLPDRIGHVQVVTDVDEQQVFASIETALA